MPPSELVEVDQGDHQVFRPDNVRPLMPRQRVRVAQDDGCARFVVLWIGGTFRLPFGVMGTRGPRLLEDRDISVLTWGE